MGKMGGKRREVTGGCRGGKKLDGGKNNQGEQ